MYRLGGWNAGDQLCWKKFGDLVNSRLNMCQQCVHTAREAECNLGSIKHSTASQSTEGIVLLCTALVQPHWVLCAFRQRSTIRTYNYWLSWNTFSDSSITSMKSLTNTTLPIWEISGRNQVSNYCRKPSMHQQHFYTLPNFLQGFSK